MPCPDTNILIFLCILGFCGIFGVTKEQLKITSLIVGLSLEQVDILWHCLVEDSECFDDALHWFLNQVRSKDQHAMGMETYKHLFLEKVCPELIATNRNVSFHINAV